MPDQHVWITGASRAAFAEAVSQYGADASADCHRRLRGPYTALGSILRELVPQAGARDPELLALHAMEILATAPELEPLTGPAPETLTSMAPPSERTRWYSRYRTRRISNGIIDFLRQCTENSSLTLAFGSVDDADPTDIEFLSIALRRLDPARVRLIICSREIPPGLEDAVASYARLNRLPAPPAQATGRQGTEPTAASFVASDGTSDVPAELDAYRRATAAVRQRLHDERAGEIQRSGDWSHRLGALPYHLEHGSSPAAGLEAYNDAVNYCISMAYYDAGLELARRVLSFIDAESDPNTHYRVQAQICQCLALLERPEETEPIYNDLLARAPGPKRHMNISYALAMLYTRNFAPERKDHRKALAYVNTAITIASLLEDPQERVFHTAFMNNGKALVEMHLGNLTESLRVVDDGISRLDLELAPGGHRLHRSVLRHNRGQVLAALGKEDEALADFSYVIEVDPSYPEYRFDRGNLYAKLGRYTEALTDYEAAIALTPPFPELYFNRGDARAAIGDADGAMNDFRYVLDLEPEYLEARISLASLLLDVGEPGEAAAAVLAGLQLTPLDARLHTTLGLALLDQGDLHDACHAFDRAIELDPGLTEALVNRAVAAYEERRYDDAAADLTTALSSDPGNPDLLYNRGLACEAAGQFQEAVTDYTAALEYPDADRSSVLYHRGKVHAVLGQSVQARADLVTHLAMGDSPYEREVREQLDAQGSA